MTEHRTDANAASTPEIPADDAQALANEWVNDLKRKAKTRFVLLGLVSVVAMSLGGVSFVTHQEQQRLVTETGHKGQQIVLLEQQLDEQIQVNKSLDLKLEQVNQAKAFLEQVKGDTASQLNIAQKIIETQNQKIDLIESEYKTSTEAIASLEGELVKVNNVLSKTSSSLKSSKADFNKRSKAYSALVKRQKETKEEVSRLSSLLETREAELKSAKQQVNSLKRERLALNEELSSLHSEVQALSTLAEVSGNDNFTDQPISANQKSGEETVMAQHSLAFQPIVEKKTSLKSIAPQEKETSTVVDSNLLLIP